MKYDFHNLLAAFAWYREHAGIALRGDQIRSDLLGEADKRLRQLGVLVARIESIESDFGGHLAPDRLLGFNQWDEIALWVECFYYIAFRCCRVLELLPGLADLRYRRILLARNKLIEHADTGDAKIFSDSMSWSPAAGLTLRSIRQEWDGKAFTDNGFVRNLGEFVMSLFEHIEALKANGIPTCEPLPISPWAEAHKKFHSLPTAERKALRQVVSSGGFTIAELKDWIRGVDQTLNPDSVVSELCDRYELVCLDQETGKLIITPRLGPSIEKLLATCYP